MSDKFKTLENELPAIVPRVDIPKYLGGLMSTRHLANLDSEGKGPKRIKIGGRIAYRREDLIKWLESRIVMME